MPTKTSTTVEEIKPRKKFGAPVGIDLGLTTLATTNRGKKFERVPTDGKLQKRINTLNRELSRRQIGSARYLETKQALARVHEKIANRRQNHIHQISHEIMQPKPSLVAMEDLNVKGMVKNRRLSKAISNAAMSELTRQLKYKQAWNGGKFVQISRFYPSSKTCSKCLHVLADLPMSTRVWRCPECGKNHDRDVNAARNILAQAAA